jgi:protein disulfide-isomerase A1
MYEKLAQKYVQHADKVLLARMDLSKNDPPVELNVQSLPAFRLFRAQSNQMVEYKGELNEAALISFITLEGSNKVAASHDYPGYVDPNFEHDEL